MESDLDGPGDLGITFFAVQEAETRVAQGIPRETVM